MKACKALIVAGCLLFSSLQALVLEEITYDSLQGNPYTDHVAVFQKLFRGISIFSMVEFGVGIGTKYFLDHIPYVISVEILCGTQTEEWYNRCLHLYASYPNWSPILYKGTSLLSWANDTALTGKDPSLTDASYVQELSDLIVDVISKNEVEMVFVDPGIHNRGDIVNCLFNLVDIIALHDTNYSGDIYGWNRVRVPDNYEQIVFSTGHGTTFWIKKNRTDVLSVLKNVLLQPLPIKT